MIVACRLRPLSPAEHAAGQRVCCEAIAGDMISIHRSDTAGSYLKSQAGQVNDYAFDVVFDANATQLEVYERTTKPFIANVVEGLNVTVFAYGSTSAGKTHTMFGNCRQDEASVNAEAGIIPNAVADVFKLIEEKKTISSGTGESYDVSISFVEVYNETILDLLNPTSEYSNKGLALREDQEKGIVVIAGVTEQKVDTLAGVMEVLAYGSKNRKTESTNANQTSSRSHAILQLTISHTFCSNTTGGLVVVDSKLSLIDLAGSERASATSNSGARLHEGANINKSLLALANCINALAENQTNNGKKGNVKFRDSKLTLLLKNSLEGNSNLVMICNLCPSNATYEDSHNTLKYANRAKNIKVNPIMKETYKEQHHGMMNERLLSENTQLRARIVYLEQVIRDLRMGIDHSTIDLNHGQEIETTQMDMSVLQPMQPTTATASSSANYHHPIITCPTSQPATSSSGTRTIMPSAAPKPVGRGGNRRRTLAGCVGGATNKSLSKIKTTSSEMGPVKDPNGVIEEGESSDLMTVFKRPRLEDAIVGWENHPTTNTAADDVHTISMLPSCESLSLSSSSSESVILPMILDTLPIEDDCSNIPHGMVIPDNDDQQGTVDDMLSAEVEVPRNLKALKRRRQSAIPMFSARGGGGSSNNTNNALINAVNSTTYPGHVDTSTSNSSDSDANNHTNCPIINNSNDSTAVPEAHGDEVCAMDIVNLHLADELSTLPTEHHNQPLLPPPAPPSKAEEFSSGQSSSSVLDEEIGQAVTVHDNDHETLLVPVATFEDDGTIDFDLGSSSSNNTGLKSGTSRGNNRGRPSIAVSSRLASNRRKSMAAINNMLDNLQAIGLTTTVNALIEPVTDHGIDKNNNNNSNKHDDELVIMTDDNKESKQEEHSEEYNRSDPSTNSSSSNNIVQIQSNRRNNRRMSTRSQLMPEPRSSVTISIPQDVSSSSSSLSSSSSTTIIDKQQINSVQESHTKGMTVMTNKRKSLIGGTKGNKGKRLSSVPITSHKGLCSDMEASQGEVGKGEESSGLGEGRLRKEAWMEI